MTEELANASELGTGADDTDQKINPAIETVPAGLPMMAYPLAKGWTLALVGTLRTNIRVAEALTINEPAWKLHMVRSAILLAHPAKG